MRETRLWLDKRGVGRICRAIVELITMFQVETSRDRFRVLEALTDGSNGEYFTPSEQSHTAGELLQEMTAAALMRGYQRRESVKMVFTEALRGLLTRSAFGYSSGRSR